MHKTTVSNSRPGLPLGIPGYIILTVNLHLDAVDPDAVTPDSSGLGGGVYGGEGGTSHHGDRKDRNHQKKRRCSDKYLNHQKKRRCSDRFFGPLGTAPPFVAVQSWSQAGH